MNEEIKMGMVIAYQSVKEEMDTIKVELERKGFEEPKGFSLLEGFVTDNINQLNRKYHAPTSAWVRKS